MSLTRNSHANIGGSQQEQDAIAAREAAASAPEYTEQASADRGSAGGTGNNSPSVPVGRTQQRFQSLSFEGEDAPPPEYARVGRGGRQRNATSSLTSPPSSP